MPSTEDSKVSLLQEFVGLASEYVHSVARHKTDPQTLNPKP